MVYNHLVFILTSMRQKTIEYSALRTIICYLAKKIAEVADMIHHHTSIPYSLVGTSEMSNFNMLKKTMLFKNKKPTKNASELEKEMDGFLRKDPQFTSFCTRFVTFVIQYACLKTNLDSTKILGKLRNTKAIPARLVEVLKRNSCFTEFKNLDDDYDGVSITTLAHNTQEIHPTSDPSHTGLVTSTSTTATSSKDNSTSTNTTTTSSKDNSTSTSTTTTHKQPQAIALATSRC